MFNSELFGDDIKKALPIINTNGSDSAMFDNCLELLVMAGRSLPHAVMMMVPEPWENHETMSTEKRAFYEYHSCLMEPWDGPAAIAFTDGRCIGAVLDRNGLRPVRYYITSDDLVIMASEAGVLPIEPEKVVQKGRLQPGSMFLVDTEQGRIVPDEEIKQELAAAKPYGDWLKENHILLEDLPEAPDMHVPDHSTAAAAPAGLRLHLRRSARRSWAPWPGRHAAARLHGHRHAAGGPLRPAPAALQLFQAALCPGHQSAHRPDPRGDRHLHHDPDRLGGQPAEADGSERPDDQAGASAALPTRSWKSCASIDQPGFKAATLSLLFPAADGAAGDGKGAGEPVCSRRCGHRGRQQPS